MRTIILIFLLPLIVYSQDKDRRNAFRVRPSDYTYKIGDTLFTSCYADKYSTPICDFKCVYLDSAIKKINLLENAHLDIYIIRDFVEYCDESQIKDRDFEMGYFQWDFNRARFVKRYFLCRGMSLPMYCHIISLESTKNFQKRVYFAKDQPPFNFVFIVIRDSSIVNVADSLFAKEIDILPLVDYDSLTGLTEFSSTEILGEIGNYLLDNPDKKAVISLKTNIMKNDTANVPLIVSFRKSFLMPLGLIGLIREDIELNLLWSTKKTYNKNNKLIESLMLKIVEK